MIILVCSGILLYLSALFFILGGLAFANEVWSMEIAEEVEPPPDRLPSGDLWFMSIVCFVIGGSLLIIMYMVY